MATTNLVLLAYGKAEVYNGTIFCLLSFLAHYQSAQIVRPILYTDDPSYFESYLSPFDMEYVELSPAVLKEMLGGSDYIHRRKIAVIAETFKKYPDDNVLFIDSDAFFTSNPSALIQKISTGTSFMHLREYTFEGGLNLFASFNQEREPKAFIDFLSRKPVIISGIETWIDKSRYCWNSGVLGLHSSTSVYMSDIFKLTDDIFRNSLWFISEQLAFSIVLDEKSNIQPSDQYVLHYWGARQKALMNKFLEESLPLLVLESASYKLIKQFTGRWKKNISNDILLEQATIAFGSNNWYYGFKKVIQLLYKNPFSPSILKYLIK